MSTILTFLLIGTVCVTYNKPLAKELARLYLIPVKWFVGEKPWMIKTQGYFLIWMRFTLYAVTLISVFIIISELGYLLGFF